MLSLDNELGARLENKDYSEKWLVSKRVTNVTHKSFCICFF
jgi:hypothetical protein